MRKNEEEDVSNYWMTLRKRKEYCKLKEEVLDRTLRRSRFGRGNGPVKTDYRMMVQLSSVTLAC